MRDDRGDEGESLDTACSARRFIQRNERHQNCGKCGEYVGQIPMPLGGRMRWIDPCIAEIVAALNSAGIRTEASCCGHGTQPGSILLEDGREFRIFDPEPKPPEEWTWNDDIPPPVDLPEGMAWGYDHSDAWDILSGDTVLGYVRRQSGLYFYRVNNFETDARFIHPIHACRELAQLVELMPFVVPKPEPADEWTWNHDTPPPVELPSAEMWWRYEAISDSWHVMRGPPFSMGHVRRDPLGHFLGFYRDTFACYANAHDACRELARVLRDRGRKRPES